MNPKNEIEKLKKESVNVRATEEFKSEKWTIIAFAVTLFFIALLYSTSTPALDDYPNGSIYKIISPVLGFYIIVVIDVLATYYLATTYGNRWVEYNNLIKEAQEVVKQEKAAERDRLQQKKMDEFASSMVKLTDKYGEPDARLVTGSHYDINSYIMPFSKVHKILILGKDMDFSDIIDVQLSDDKHIIKGQIIANTETDSGSAIGRSIVGGILGGGTGAIIGGSTASKTTTFKQKNDIVEHNYTVLVTTKNISQPLIKIELNKSQELANKIVATLKAVIANQ